MTTFSVGMFLALVIATPAEPARVAVVNVAVASEKYQKTSDLEGQFEQLRKKLNEQRDGLKGKIDRLNRSLQEELKPGTDEYRERRKQIALLEAELQWFMETEGQRVERGLAESLKSIYTDIQTAVREVAEQKGIDIVLAADQLPESTPDSATQVRQQILLQKVIYANPRVDLTGEVVTRLNETYRRQAAKPPTNAPPPQEPHDEKSRPEPSNVPGANERLIPKP